MTNGPTPPADWYPDPEAAAGHLRYWDGSAWTEDRWAPTPAGWYPDEQAPEGHQRYWDGSAWTEDRWAPPSPTAAQRTSQTDTPTSSSTPPVGEWVKRHRILSGLIAAVTVILLFSAVSSSAEDDTPSDAASGHSTDADSGSSSAADENLKDGTASPKPTSEPKPKPKRYLVVRVVDGDTVDLRNGKTVRLAGIDAPEVGECGHKRATTKLAGLVLGKRVRLGASDEDHDRYGRLLRYVDVGHTDAGLALIKAGLAIARYDSRDGYGFHPREPKYIAADEASKNISCAKPVPLAAQPKPAKNCAPGYTPCIRPYPPDLDCPDIGHPVHVTGSDPHGLDRDGDGIACEWS